MKHSDPSKPTPAPFGLSLGQCALVMAAILILSAVGIQMLDGAFLRPGPLGVPERTEFGRVVFGILDETSRTSVALLLWVLTTKVLLRWVRIEDALFGRGPWPDEGEDRVRAAVVRGWFLLGGAIVLAVAMG